MGQNSPVRVLGFPADDFACGHWRVIQPARAMRDARVEAQLLGGTQVSLDRFDVAVFQRILWPQQLDSLRMLKSNGKKLVIDYDDAFPITDPNHSDYKDHSRSTASAAVMDEALSLADAVTVPTPQLAEHYGRLHRRVVCLPNAVDVDWPPYQQGPIGRPTEKLIVYWSGWTSHEANLRMVEPAVTRLLMGRDDAVLAICGPVEFTMIFPALRGAGKVVHVERLPFETFMRLASIADVVIAPLEVSAFNDNKSEIRLIEAGVWRAPTVASPAAPYRRFEGGSGNCVLVEGNSVEGWHEALKRLLDDAGLREKVGRKARTAVEEKYSLQEVNQKRAELWASL